MKIKLSKGMTCIIDDIDSDLSGIKWCASAGGAYGHNYYARNVWKRKMLHREIGTRIAGRKLKRGEVVDHVNGDTLDNRRKNLRVVSASANTQNTTRRRNNTSGYTGVSWHNHTKKWRAMIKVNGHHKYVGVFSDRDDAARAYNLAAIKYFGPQAAINKVTNEN